MTRKPLVRCFECKAWQAMQGKLHKRIRMLLRYTAGTGLFNQQYSHISAIALASVLGAELILPPGVHPCMSDSESCFQCLLALYLHEYLGTRKE